MRADSDPPDAAPQGEPSAAPTAAAATPAAAAVDAGVERSPSASSPAGSAVSLAAAGAPRGRCNTLLLSFLLFVLVCFVVWVVSAGKRYREQYAQATEGWRVGTTRMIEITLGPGDKQGLACASDRDFWGLRCSGDREFGDAGPEPDILQPYNTTTNQLFLGAGLWSSPELDEPLPARRFTVVCNYHIRGVARSAAIRFGRAGRFAPMRKTVTVGTLTDCVIPR